MNAEKKLVDALRIIAAHEVAAPLTMNDDNVSLSDLPFYVAGKAHAELGILHNIARNALDAYEARPVATGDPRFFIDHGQIHDRVTGKHITTDEDTVFCDGINHCLALLNELARRPDGFMLATHCFECNTELHGPYCPECAQEDWQDIATAPQDGTPILLGSTEWQTVWRGYYLSSQPPGEPDHRWREHGPRWQRSGMTDTNLHPTHWRSLPAPPNHVRAAPEHKPPEDGLAELRALSEKATPGPWKLNGDISEVGDEAGTQFIIGENLGGLVGGAMAWSTELDSGDFSRVIANALLITAAVNHVRAEIERAKP